MYMNSSYGNGFEAEKRDLSHIESLFLDRMYTGGHE